MRGKYYKIKARHDREREESLKTQIIVHYNRCGSNMHDTNSCPNHPFHIKRKEVHLMN
jgi:hypothetical protein